MLAADLVSFTYYRPPHGLPLRWRDETSGELPQVFFKLMNHWSDPKNPAPNTEEIDLIRSYLVYYINAPCWLLSDMQSKIDQLKVNAIKIKTVDDINHWIDRCWDIGLDPL